MRTPSRTISTLAACLSIGLVTLGCARRGSDEAPAARASATAASSAEPTASAPAPGASAAASPTPAQPARLQHPAEQVLTRWNSALDRHDEDALAKLYASHVRFYGIRKTAAEVLGAKHQAFQKEPDFHQRVSDVAIEKSANGFVVNFKKRYGADLTQSVDARIALESTDNELRIVEETDAVTDKRFKKKAPPTSCFDAVTSAVSSLPPIEADQRRVAKTNPQLTTGGILYDEQPGTLSAAQGYFHPERFEPRWWIDVANGELSVRDALSGEALAVAESLRASVRQACAVPEVDAGATKRK